MLAVDWSGDAGAAGKAGSAAYFALAIVSYNEGEIGAILAQLRRDQRLPDRFEYHFAEGLGKADRIRHDFIRALTRSDIRVAILCGEKAALPLTEQHQGVPFLAACICDLLQHLPTEQVDGVALVIDGTKGETKRLCALVRHLLRQQPYRPKRPRGIGSHQCDGIQVADMLAGAARHRVAGKIPDYLAPLKSKIILKGAA